ITCTRAALLRHGGYLPLPGEPAMFCRTALTCVFLTAWTSTAAAQTSMLDLIPGNASAGVALRNLNDLRKKGDKLLVDANLQLPLRPTQLFDILFRELGITGGLDHDGTVALVLAPPEKKEEGVTLQNLEQLLVLILPCADRDRLAQNFGITKGTLKPNQMTPGGKGRFFGRFFYARGRHLYLGNSAGAIDRVVRGKPAGGDLPAKERRAFNESDIVLHLGVRAWAEDWKSYLKELENSFGKGDDPAEKQVVRQLLDCLAGARYGVGALRI